MKDLESDIVIKSFFNQGNWGIKNSQDNIVIPPTFNSIEIFSWEEGQLIRVFNSRKSVLMKLGQYADFRTNSNPVIVLLKRGSQSFLLQLTYDYKISTYSTSHLLNTLHTYQDWNDYQLKLRNTEKTLWKEVDFITYQHCYKRIEFIGEGLFKVELMTPYQSLDAIDEHGGTAWYLHFFPSIWKILTPKGSFLPFVLNGMETYVGGYCKVKKFERYNLLDTKYQLVNKQWFKCLDHPAFNSNDFLAGSYYLITYYDNKEPHGRSFSHTFNLNSPNDEDWSEEITSLLGKLNKIDLSSGELQLLLNSALGMDNFTVVDLPSMDWYEKGAMKKKLQITELRQISPILFTATVYSQFYFYYDTIKSSFRCHRHMGLTEIPTAEYFGYAFEQKRLIDSNGNFIGSNYYHEILEFDQSGKALVSKTFFYTENEEIDTSVDEFFSDGIPEYWANRYSDRLPDRIKYGYIDHLGNEILECKLDIKDL